MASQTLIKGGTLLIHDNEDKVVPVKADLLIKGSTIVKIQDDIPASSTASIIDCTGKIVCPGFINTHQHTWQTQLKGSHPDDSLLKYFCKGNFANFFYSPEDVFWGQLAGCMELIDSGTTTVVDHASVTYSPDHPIAAVRATVASGIRCIFGYCPTPRVSSWIPEFKLEQDLFPPWVMATWDRLAAQNPFGPSGRVKLGFAFDGLWLPGDVLKALFQRVRQQGSHLITTHAMHCAMFGGSKAKTAVEILSSHQLLSSDILLSHANNPNPGDEDLLLSSGAHTSSTPSTELQMGHGNPICLDRGYHGSSSLGVDCHSLCSTFLPSQMMLALQTVRANKNETLYRKGQWTASVESSVEQVFNLGTILGARAIGMEKEIGSLAEGKKADLVIFDGSTPSMAVASKRSPVAAIVMHSSVRDISTVIVDGIIRKDHGILCDVGQENATVLGKTIDCTIGWQEVVSHVEKRAEDIDAKKQKQCDKSIAMTGVIDAFYMNKAGLTGEAY